MSLASLAVLAAAILAEAVPLVPGRRGEGVMIFGNLGGRLPGPPTISGFGLTKSGLMGLGYIILPTGSVSLGPAINGLTKDGFYPACYLFFVLIRV